MNLPNCPHCAAPLPIGALVCPTCRELVYKARLIQLFQEAARQETIDPNLAATTWRQCLPLIPPNTVEYQQIANRAAALSGGVFAGIPATPGAGPIQLDYAPPQRRQETWLSVLAKTGGSMAFCMYLYARRDGWPFAIGFVLLILIHELGHTLANYYYGLKQSPPFFLPYMGAVIMLRQNPQDAKVESVVGIAGPVAGTIGAIGCFAFYVWTGNDLFLRLSMYAFLLNLFNLIPVWPLDGGRVAAGITPILWIPGALAFGGVLLYLGGYQSVTSVFLAFWILQSTIPRIRDVVFRGGMNSPYYRIGAPARIAIIVSYLLLSLLLAVMFLRTLYLLHA